MLERMFCRRGSVSNVVTSQAGAGAAVGGLLSIGAVYGDSVAIASGTVINTNNQKNSDCSKIHKFSSYKQADSMIKSSNCFRYGCRMILYASAQAPR